jgi:hypothetical protein
MSRRGLLLALAVVASAGCSGSARVAAPSPTTAVPPTTERQRPSSNTTTVAVTTTSTVAVTEPGLPSSFPVPDTGFFILSGGSLYSNTVSIVGVPLADVHAWVLQGLGGGGYTVVVDDGASNVEFDGPGVSGTVMVTESSGGIRVVVTMGAPR